MFTIDIEQLKNEIVANSIAVQEAVRAHLSGDEQDVNEKTLKMSEIIYSGFGCYANRVRELMSLVTGMEIPVGNTSNNRYSYPRKMFVVKLVDNLTREHNYPFYPQQPILITGFGNQGLYIETDQEGDGSYTHHIRVGGNLPMSDKGLKSLVFCTEEEIRAYIDQLVEASKDFTDLFFKYRMQEATWRPTPPVTEATVEDDEEYDEEYDEDEDY